LPVAAVRMEGIVKRFPGVFANDHITLEVRQGEIHTLLGENGAGKTTLMNILYGLYNPDEGKIYLKGKPIEINSPKQAIEHGINMVHQHFMLIPVFTVAENIILGNKVPRAPLLDLKQVAKRVTELSDKYGFSVDPHARVWQLPVGVQQRVEILKALYRGAEILILDEPTAVLTPGEIEDLFTVLREMVQQGKTIIFISHKLPEVMTISDRITVLRDGRVVGTVKTEETNEAALAKMMVGREVFLKFDKPPFNPEETILAVDGIHVMGDKGVPAARNVSFGVRSGEILGIAGVDGNGQSELAEAIMGLRHVQSGEVRIQNQVVNGYPSRAIIDMGVAFIPPDRRTMGMVEDFSLSENLLLKNWAQPPFVKYGLFDFNAIDSFCRRMIKEYDIRAPDSQTKMGNLSGGNQQKVVLARETSQEPRLLIALQPTRGLDVAATEYVHNRLLKERERGAAILLISTELEEILSLSDRIAVLYKGEIMGIVTAEGADVNEIGLMMAGAKRNNWQ
jgi:ABC-type uncharacterized transport system ATPase subunit